jgi:DNA-binding NtrC family response regulator
MFQSSFAAAAVAAGPAAGPAIDPRFLDSPILPLTEMERRAIVHALEYTKGDRLMAAGLLGIGRTTLYRKLKEYQMAV